MELDTHDDVALARNDGDEASVHGMILDVVDVVVDVDTRNVQHYYWFGCLEMMLDIC